jgi:hypothetical protein
MNIRIQMVATAAALLLTFSMQAHAADAPHVSGGAGEDERQVLLTKERDYNLKVIACSTPRWTGPSFW